MYSISSYYQIQWFYSVCKALIQHLHMLPCAVQTNSVSFCIANKELYCSKVLELQLLASPLLLALTWAQGEFGSTGCWGWICVWLSQMHWLWNSKCKVTFPVLLCLSPVGCDSLWAGSSHYASTPHLTQCCSWSHSTPNCFLPFLCPGVEEWRSLVLEVTEVHLEVMLGMGCANAVDSGCNKWLPTRQEKARI